MVLCPSLNGFGHIRRMIALKLGLNLLGHQADFLVTDRLTVLQRELINEAGVTPLILDSSFYSVSIFEEGPYVGKAKADCIPNLSSLDYLNYDCVVADTVTWPLLINVPSIFVGQFTWSMYFNHSEANEILDSFQSIIGIDLFSWPLLKAHSKYKPLPVIDYWNFRAGPVKLLDDIGLATNGSNPEPLAVDRNLLVPVAGIPEFLKAYGWLPKYIVMRAGLGNVMEALAAGVVPILTSDDGLDIVLNKRVLLANRYALDFSDVDIDSKRVLSRYRSYDGPVINQVEFAKVVVEGMC